MGSAVFGPAQDLSLARTNREKKISFNSSIELLLSNFFSPWILKSDTLTPRLQNRLNDLLAGVKSGIQCSFIFQLKEYGNYKW